MINDDDDKVLHGPRDVAVERFCFWPMMMKSPMMKMRASYRSAMMSPMSSLSVSTPS